MALNDRVARNTSLHGGNTCTLAGIDSSYEIFVNHNYILLYKNRITNYSNLKHCANEVIQVCAII